MKKLIVVLAVFMAACLVMPVIAQPVLVSAPADAGIAKLTYGPDRWIDLHLLFQMQYTNTFTWDPSGAAGETDSDGVWSSNFAPKRMRMMFNGQVAPNLTFFVETDLMNSVIYAKKSSISNPPVVDETQLKNEQYVVFLQDAYVNYKVADELQITFGMLLLPFMHHNRQSAVSLLGVNYNTTAVNIAESTVWRDYGVEFRGLLANKMIDYRIGVFDGVERKVDTIAADTKDDVNPQGLPRVTGRIQINLMDAEEGFFYSGNYLGKKKIVSFGGGIDYMKEARYYAATTEVKDYMAWTADVTIDYPLNPNLVIAFQAAYVKMENRTGTLSITGAPALAMPENEYGYFAQAGLLINSTFQPVVKFASWVYEEAIGTEDVTLQYLTLGLNYFINGHNANIKIEYQMPIGKVVSGTNLGDLPNQKVVTLQAQIYI